MEIYRYRPKLRISRYKVKVGNEEADYETFFIPKETADILIGLLDDSDIAVLQKNYDYLFWSILATGTVVVAMNIVKK